MSMLAMMVEKDADPEKLGKMMDLAERWAANEAAKKYAEAISGFQSECPMVFKSREVSNNQGKVMYRFANYEDIVATIRDLLKKWGIVVTFTIDQPDQLMKGTVRIRVGTHFEDSTLSVPVPKGLNTNATQDFGMAVSYLKRYLLCAALNIVVTGEDNDARGLLHKIDAGQIEQLNIAVDRCERVCKNPAFDRKKFMAYLQAAAKIPIEDFGDIPSNLFDDAMTNLTKRADKAERGQP
jgi:hypothetical protein